MKETNEPLYIDSREPASVVEAFKKHGFFKNIIVKKMETGDIQFGHLVFERKAFIDFLNSWREGRLDDQVERLANLPEDMVGVIIIHDYAKSDRWIKPGLRAAGLKHINSLNFVVPTFKVRDMDVMINRIMGFAEHALDGKYLFKFTGRKAHAASAKNRIIHFYAGMPGIGEDLAEKLYEKYPNPMELFNEMRRGGMLNQPEGKSKVARRRKMWHAIVHGIGDGKAQDVEEMLIQGQL